MTTIRSLIPRHVQFISLWILLVNWSIYLIRNPQFVCFNIYLCSYDTMTINPWLVINLLMTIWEHINWYRTPYSCIKYLISAIPTGTINRWFSDPYKKVQPNIWRSYLVTLWGNVFSINRRIINTPHTTSIIDYKRKLTHHRKRKWRPSEQQK